jgi:phosphatidylethanolamine-binding protein (PEBP) family uncharacterized protein
MSFKLSSQSFNDGDYLPAVYILSKDYGFGCVAGDHSPHLAWSGAPSGTALPSLLRSGRADRRRVWHWLVVNIAATVRCRSMPAI